MTAVRSFLQRMRARRNAGTAMVEFAIIAPAFFLLMFAIIETGLVFFANGELENGTGTVARLIRTGQAQGQGMTQSQFRTALCNQISLLLACDVTKLQVDVESYTSFANVTFTNPLTAGKTLNSGLQNYITGGPCDIVVVRTFYVWPLYTPMFSTYFANMTNNSRLVSAAYAFRNEPYGSTTC